MTSAPSSRASSSWAERSRRRSRRRRRIPPPRRPRCHGRLACRRSCGSVGRRPWRPATSAARDGRPRRPRRMRLGIRRRIRLRIRLGARRAGGRLVAAAHGPRWRRDLFNRLSRRDTGRRRGRRRWVGFAPRRPITGSLRRRAPSTSMIASTRQSTPSSSIRAWRSISSAPLRVKLSRAPAVDHADRDAVSPSTSFTWAFWLSRIQA